MTPEEQYNALVMERDIANDNIVNINNEISKIVDVLEAYKSAAPEQQEAAKPYLQEVVDKYENLKAQRAQQEDRWGIAQNALNNYQAPVEEPVVQVVRRPSPTPTPTPTPTPEVPDTILDIRNFDQWPEAAKQAYYLKNGKPWTLTEGEGTSVGDYLGNVWQWFTENINPTTWVYQNNSRAPGYNVWRKLGNAFIPVAWMLGAQYLVGPNVWAEEAAKTALFRSNVNKVTNIPAPNYTASPSNIPIKWTSASNLPKYTTAPSRAPVPNLWRSNPSNIKITPTSLTKFRIPWPTITLE